MIYAAFILIYLLLIYRNEVTGLFAGEDLKYSFLRQNVRHSVFAPLALCVSALIACMIKYGGSLPRCFRVLWSLLFSGMAGAFTYVPNLFKNPLWHSYHIHAYTNSIVNTMAHAPFDEVNCSIYGHHGLIYYPLVKLLGGDYLAIALSIAFFAFVMYLCACYVLDALIDNDYLYAAAVAALIGTTLTYFGGGNYFQIIPHRYLFPLLTLAYITRLEKILPGKPRSRLCDLFLGAAAIIFNLETGLCCSVVLAAYRFFGTEFRSVKHFLVKVFKALLCVTVCFALAYILVNLYNLACGGNWNSLSTFIYPIGSESYDMSEILRTPIQNPLTGYTLHMIVFCAGLFDALYRLHSRKNNARNMILLSTALSGLGSLIYFMNRSAATCLAITHIQLIIILAAASKEFLKINMEKLSLASLRRLFLSTETIASVLLISFFAGESLLSIENTLINRMTTVYETVSLQDDIAAFDKWLPDDAAAFGMAMPEIYCMMERDPKVYVTDWAGQDMTAEGLAFIDAVLGRENRVFVTADTLEYVDLASLLDANGYSEQDRFVGQNFECIRYGK